MNASFARESQWPRSVLIAMASLVAVGCGWVAPRRPRAPKPPPVEPPTPHAIEAAITRGVDFLVRRQNRDGSWGSPCRTKALNIYAPVPGAHYAFRAAVTALCLSALIETADQRPEVQRAITTGRRWLESNLDHVRRPAPRAIYNNWSHAYAIQALVRLMGRTSDEAQRARLRELTAGQVERLGRYESLGGGWGYYDFVAHTQRPSGRPTSFTTATVLIALKEAEAAGIAVPPGMVERGLAALRRQRKPDFSYLYSANLWWWPMFSVNRPAASLGRSQACNLALRLWGDQAVTDTVLMTWLDRLFARNGWLSIGRKRPVPHEAWFQVAGYFFYYGHYYAALCIEQLPPARRPFYQAQMASVLLALQEKDGSWWDFPLYDYHQQYGTAFALMALSRCRRRLTARAASTLPTSLRTPTSN